MSAPRSRLSVGLWLAFAGSVAASGFVLLHACGLLLPYVGGRISWNFCPLPPTALAREGERDAVLRNLAHDLERELARRRLACASIPKSPPPPLDLPRRADAQRPQQTALLKPPPPPPKPVDLPADRWAKKDLGLLEGCWVLGRESVTSYLGVNGKELCRVPAGRLCFGPHGEGRRETTIICPTPGRFTCTPSVTARFADDGTLRTTQPTVGCSDGQTTHNGPPNNLTCRRISDAMAICRDGEGYEHEFRR